MSLDFCNVTEKKRREKKSSAELKIEPGVKLCASKEGPQTMKSLDSYVFTLHIPNPLPDSPDLYY